MEIRKKYIHNIHQRIGVVALSVSMALGTGCATMEKMGITKQQVGTGLGALAGVLIGSQIGDGSGRKIAMVLGGLGGAYLGGRIGQNLDEKDRQAAIQALDDLEDNQSTTYSNPDTGKTTRFTVNNTQEVERDVPIVRHKSVQASPPMKLIGKTYVALKNSNVRNAPTTSGSVVLTGLQAGEAFTAVGKVAGRPWIMVAQNDITIGYVYETLVSEATAPEVKQQVVLREAVDLDAMEASVQTTYKPVDLDQELIVENTKVATSCREVTYAQDGAADSFQACRAADGAWEISS